MNLEKMLQMQKDLDTRIIKEKGLEGKDLFHNTVVALQVEIGEFANEGRWFKHWSHNQEPRTKAFKGPFIDAEDSTEYNPLLEEYVDCVHFYLSIAIQKGWTESLYIYEDAMEEISDSGLDGGLTGAFLEMNFFLVKCAVDKKPLEIIEKTLGISTQEFYFKNAWFIFLAIGLIGFGFTPQQIEQAYIEKNTVNHQRQEQGY
jgi:dimeric dUTPase (all-alpha-NTP-PPase superfamily)